MYQNCVGIRHAPANILLHAVRDCKAQPQHGSMAAAIWGQLLVQHDKPKKVTICAQRCCYP